MKLIKSNVFAVLAVTVAMQSLALSLEINPVSAASSPAAPQQIPSVVYTNAATKNPPPEGLSVGQVPSLGAEENTSSRVTFFRTESLSIASFRSNMFVRNDHAAFAINAQTPVVNGALSFVGTVYQAPLDDSMSKWIQVLSLAATRKINAEFSYSARLNKYSSFNSVISYSLHPATDSGNFSDVAASFQYRIKF